MTHPLFEKNPMVLSDNLLTSHDLLKKFREAGVSYIATVNFKMLSKYLKPLFTAFKKTRRTKVSHSILEKDLSGNNISVPVIYFNTERYEFEGIYFYFIKIFGVNLGQCSIYYGF